MPAKGPGFGGNGRVGGGSGGRSASMRGSAPRSAPKTPKSSPSLYHGTSWKYKPGDVTKSTSATTSYRTAKKYSTSGRAGRGPWLPGTGPSTKASGKPTVYKVTPAKGVSTTSSRKYRTTKSEVNSPDGWKIEGKAKRPTATMRAETKGSEGPKKSSPAQKNTKKKK